MGLAERIREAMGEMSPAELARRAKVTPGAVTQWLDGTTKSLRGEKAAQLEVATGYRATWLATGSGPKKAAAADNALEYAGPVSGHRRVPVVGTAKMGEDGFYEELSPFPGAGDGYVEHVSADPNAYALRVRGSSMYPAIRDGSYVVIEPNGQPVPGEPVLVILRNGKKMVKEFLIERQDSIEVESVNGGHRHTIYRDELESVQPVSAVLYRSKWKPD